jgi:hypothetical protein
MIELQKKDIPVLDFIVNELSKSGTYIFTLNDLQKEQKFGFGKNEFTSIENMLNDEQTEFIRLLHILHEFKVAKCNFEEDFESAKPNSFTKQFSLQNGFANEFKKQNKKNLDWYKIIPITLTFVFGCSTFYFAYLNHQLKLNESRIPALEKKVDSLNKKLNLLKSKLIVNKEKP